MEHLMLVVLQNLVESARQPIQAEAPPAEVHDARPAATNVDSEGASMTRDAAALCNLKASRSHFAAACPEMPGPAEGFDGRLRRPPA